MADDGMPAHLMNPISGSKGGGGQSRTPIEAPDSLYSTAMARIVDLLSEGEIEMWNSDNPLKDVFLDETPVMNADGSLNFQSVQVEYRTGTADQDPIPGFPSVQSEIGVGVELKQVTPWVRAVNNVQLSAVKIRLAVNSLSKTDNTNGDVKGYRVDYAIDLATDGGAYQEVFRSAFSGKTSTLYERTHRIDLPPATTGWNVRVRRLTADSTTAYISDTTVVQAITEIIDAKLRYPYSALVGISLDASQFRSIPRRAYRVKGRIIRVPVNYDPDTRAYTGVWNGTFKLAWTTNPAWIYYDLVTNTRYGLGKRIPESRVDKWSLYRIAQYCDELVPDGKGGTEPRFQCTVYLQKQGDAYKVIRDLASVFRGIAFWSGGTVIAQADQPEDPVYTYTNANVKDGKFTYNGTGRKARHTVAMVAWSNPDNFGKGEIEPVIDDDGIIRYGIQTTNVTAFGTISQSQAQRVGNWILKSELAETDTVSFDVGLDGTLVAPGKIIRIADQNRAGRRIGGRLSAVHADQVTVDAMPDPPPAPGDTLVTITAAGVAQEHSIHLVDAANRIIIVTAPFVNPPVEQSVWAIESAELQTQLFRVLGITNGNDGISFGMSAIQHNPSKFAAVDNGTQLETRPTSILPSTVIQGPSAVTLTSVERAGEVISSLLLQASWTPVEGASYYMVQWKRDDADWTNPEKTQSNGADLANVFPGKWWARVWAVGINGISSPQVLSNQLAVADQSLKPGFVEQLNADIAEALETAENAQATADGAIVSFWQDSPPVIGSGAGQAKVGDIWFDTNDGNKIYRVVGSSWVDAQDDQLALALSAATTAQATADGKVKTFFQSTAPTATAIGDLWFNTTAGVKKLFRWNGSTWSDEIADVTLDQLGGSGVNILPDQYSTFEAVTLPPTVRPLGGTLVRDVANAKVAAAVQLTGALGVAVYLGSSLGNLKLTPGKKYIVSAWWYSSQANNTMRMFIETNGGTYYYTPSMSCGPVANTYVRVSALLDLSANTQTNAWLGFIKDQSEPMTIDGIMVEEAIGRANVPSTYARGMASSLAIGALAAAALAQDTADGKIDSFYQTSPPTIGAGAGQATLGDLWFDTDDGNKQYRCNGSSWILVQDTAIGVALTNAAGAQATADGKVRTWFANAASVPTASAVGDLWYVTDRGHLLRWDGSGWILVADNAAETLNDYGANMKFEQGTAYWGFQTGWRHEVGGNGFSGTGYVVHDPGTVDSRLFSEKDFAVEAGEVYIVSAMVKQTGGDGSIGVGLLTYNAAGASTGSLEGAQNMAGWGLSAGVYKKIAQRVVIPNDGTKRCRVNAVVYGHTSGYWCVDNFSVTKMPTNLDDVPDSPTYAKPRSTTLNNGVPNAITGGKNLVPNPRFTNNLSLRPANAFFNSAQFICDDWACSDNFTYVKPYKEVGGSGSSINNLLMRLMDPITIPAGMGYTACSVYSSPFDVQPGKIYSLYGKWNIGRSAAPPAGVDGLLRFLIQWFDKTGVPLPANYFDASILSPGGWDYFVETSAPANATRGVFYVQLYVRNTSGSNASPGGQLWCDARVYQVGLFEKADLDTEVSNGATYGRTSNLDLIDSGGVRRIGVRISGSGQRLGSQRNTVRTQTSSYGATRSATALSATSAGVVNVNAHNVLYGSFSVSYNAVANAVTGLTPGATYVIYCYDGDYSGGTRTYYAGANPNAVMALSDDVIVVGQITIPTSGSSSGGGGSGGSGPNDWCVAEDSFLPDGTRAADLPVGDFLPCYNNDPLNPGIVMLKVQANRTGESECLRLVTESGASVVASVTTPMTLRDGSCAMLPEMLGHEALVHRDGDFSWERVVELQPAGVRRVAKISVSDQCYFAGETTAAHIATHNVGQMKP